MKSRCAILIELNKPLVIDEVEIPKLNVGQVLVKIVCSGICGAQIGEITGAKGEDPYLPHLMGHEGSGIVIDVGPGVTTVKKNDHVVLHWRKSTGIESAFPVYKWQKGNVGAGLVTTFNQYTVVSENRVTKINSDVPFEILALFGCGVTTGLGLINNEAQLKIGQTILVLGCGGVGLNIIQGALLVSARRIVGVDRSEYRLGMAKKFGVTHTFLSSEISQEPNSNWAFIKESGFDVVVDCTGASEMIDLGFSVVKPGGRMILVGQPHYGDNLIFTNMCRNYKGKVLMDSQGGLTNPSEDIPRYIWLYKLGTLRCLDWIITHHFPLEQINDAVELMKSGRCGKVILEMNSR